jgi:hypothetical protein
MSSSAVVVVDTGVLHLGQNFFDWISDVFSLIKQLLIGNKDDLQTFISVIYIKTSERKGN